ncbi:glycine betaine ABC transporter substrate-binding protein [uncultured Thioclava sp.]|uniref:glycine betaine ABC transporter substrate-binding protein n=1 Tax=uncultured Thioclava sp. TaxID=473858 RepID=UPI0025CF0A34|nr:glycine betaine ABC transporter substrate-binding protein [uncultured Thioclava sp.]
MLHILKAALLGASLFGLAGSVQAEEIAVGGKNFTEQQILASITQQYLSAKGYDVTDRSGMGSAVVRQAMENGQVDIYWEYTGTSLITYNKVTEKLNAQDTYDKVKELDAKKGIVWLMPSKANNTYALAMRADEAQKMGIETISDLAMKEIGGAKLTLASNAEFYARPDGLKPLEKDYGFDFGRANIKRMDTGLVYQALKDSQVDVGVVFATDGRIPAFNFVTLKDDKGYFPSYALAPVIRKEVLDKHPELADLMDAISAKLTDKVMAGLNANVDVDKVSVENVAAEFLKENGLI